MGQQLSSQTQTVINKLPEKVVKHVSLVRESGFLTYEEFLGRVAELNDTTAQLASGQNKHLLFEVQPGSDATALWKVAVRIVCTKINKTSGNVEASRIMNLYQFIQLYKDITSQASQVLSQNAPSEGIAEDLSSVESCQASLWMGRVKQLTDEEECCICMDGRADLILPCAHSFCQKCIDKCSRLFRLHHKASCSTSHLYADSSLSRMRPITVVSSANLSSSTDGFFEMQSLVYREKRSGESTQPWGGAVLIVQVTDVILLSFTCCFLFVRKLMIHLQVCLGTASWFMCILYTCIFE
ncbi:RING finger protein 141 isoform X1 [Ahaetulla prasina]|uniref:RING finger protein 141 isoform X1 n=1 Tax=Ahaetulla prasina TaxID=499056 RepID=UPI00264809B3|nr:RING finger protein 141 isoform X1 [Ahaetulla prasina]